MYSSRTRALGRVVQDQSPLRPKSPSAGAAAAGDVGWADSELRRMRPRGRSLKAEELAGGKAWFIAHRTRQLSRSLQTALELELSGASCNM